MRLTLAEAQPLLDPPISLRTLKRLAGDLVPAGTRRHIGRPAAEYNKGDIDRVHAQWVRRQIVGVSGQRDVVDVA